MTVDWIRKALVETGKTRSGLAKALGRSPSAVTDLLNGSRRLRAEEIAIAVEYLGVEPPRLVGGGRAPPRDGKVPLVGYVGAGAVAHFYADGQGPFDEVPAPDAASGNTVAVQIRGHSLGALFDNWLVFYDDVRDPPGRRSRRAHVRVRLGGRAHSHQGAEAQPEHRPVEPALQCRAADLRRRARLGGGRARNAAAIEAWSTSTKLNRRCVIPSPLVREG